MLARVEQIVAGAHTETCNLEHTVLLMNPDRTPKTQVSVTYFMGLNRLPKSDVNRHSQAS